MRLLLSLVPVAACLCATGAEGATPDAEPSAGALTRASALPATTTDPGARETLDIQECGIGCKAKPEDVCATPAIVRVSASPVKQSSQHETIGLEASETTRESRSSNGSLEIKDDTPAPVVKDAEPVPAKDRNEF